VYAFSTLFSRGPHLTRSWRTHSLLLYTALQPSVVPSGCIKQAWHNTRLTYHHCNCRFEKKNCMKKLWEKNVATCFCFPWILGYGTMWDIFCSYIHRQLHFRNFRHEKKFFVSELCRRCIPDPPKIKTALLLPFLYQQELEQRTQPTQRCMHCTGPIIQNPCQAVHRSDPEPPG
jgi:hypothetical protein